MRLVVIPNRIRITGNLWAIGGAVMLGSVFLMGSSDPSSSASVYVELTALVEFRPLLRMGGAIFALLIAALLHAGANGLTNDADTTAPVPPWTAAMVALLALATAGGAIALRSLTDWVGRPGAGIMAALGVCAVVVGVGGVVVARRMRNRSLPSVPALADAMWPE